MLFLKALIIVLLLCVYFYWTYLIWFVETDTGEVKEYRERFVKYRKKDKYEDWF